MVCIKSSCVVKPSEPTPNVKLFLPESDQVKPWTHAPVFFVYQPEVDNSVSTSLENLKFSLSRALVPYYPLAGRLNGIGGGRFELHCNTMGAVIIEAESDARLEDFGDFRPTSETTKLAPYVDYAKDVSELPLLLVQLTRFKCGGIGIGIAMSHIVSDGKGAFGFITTWAKINRGEKGIIQPFHDRTAFYKGDPTAKPRYDHVELKGYPVLLGNKSAKEERAKETTTRMLNLSKNQVDKLKEKANLGKPKDYVGREYSRFEAMSGHIWRCASKARRHENEQLTSLRITIDCRNRLRPPLPPRYSGNATMVTTSIAESGELLSNPLGLGFVCSVIRKCIDKVDDDYIKSATDFLISQDDLTPYRSGFHNVGSTEGVFLGNPNLAITSWVGLPINDVDFGWGKPIYMGPTALGYDGKLLIIPGKDDGSVIVPIRLQVAHIDDFEKFFYEDI
nr:BAHD acyltransferase/hydroxycinnamoyltransferase [Actaea racemosa]